MRPDPAAVDVLRDVIDRLPPNTRDAMLEGIRSHDIIVGAYSDRLGGVCPMLAAHRCGGRTSFVSFARAWDAFTGVKRARRATSRELGVLERSLVASLAADQAAIRARRAEEAARTGWSLAADRELV